MLPEREIDLLTTETPRRRPSRTYRLDLEQNRLLGETDGLDAVRQAVYLILNVERYQQLIYSWNYGVELRGLFGMPHTYVIPELERRIREALLQDDRITAVDGFTFQREGKKLLCGFTVHSLFGELNAEKEVVI